MTTKSQEQSQDGKSRDLETGDELRERLDDLLEKYLNLVDQYTRARLHFSRHLVSGYLSLAQANFSAPGRVRYGQDYYDERMQAIRRVKIESDEPLHVTIVPPEPPNYKGSKNVPVAETSEDQPESLQLPTPPASNRATPEPDAAVDEATELLVASTIDQNETKEDSKPKEQSTDPLRWFGILSPSALRNAQSSFVQAVESSVPDLLNASSEMRQLEIDIGRTRKALRKLEKTTTKGVEPEQLT